MPNTRFLCFQRSRAKENAASEQDSTVPTRTPASMIRVFRKYRANGTWVSAPEKLSQAKGFGIHCGGETKIWPASISALRTSQISGSSVGIAPASSST
jgi:hypothetical protein